MIFQILVCAETIKHNRQVEAAVEAFGESRDGTVVYGYEAPPAWLRRYVYSLKPSGEQTEYEWQLLGWWESKGKRRMTAFTPWQYESIQKIDFDKPSGKFRPFHQVGDLLVAPADSARKYHYTVEGVRYRVVDFQIEGKRYRYLAK